MDKIWWWREASILKRPNTLLLGFILLCSFSLTSCTQPKHPSSSKSDTSTGEAGTLDLQSKKTTYLATISSQMWANTGPVDSIYLINDWPDLRNKKVRLEVQRNLAHSKHVSEVSDPIEQLSLAILRVATDPSPKTLAVEGEILRSVPLSSLEQPYAVAGVRDHCGDIIGYVLRNNPSLDVLVWACESPLDGAFAEMFSIINNEVFVDHPELLDAALRYMKIESLSDCEELRAKTPGDQRSNLHYLDRVIDLDFAKKILVSVNSARSKGNKLSRAKTFLQELIEYEQKRGDQ